jgi:hypothetical protein
VSELRTEVQEDSAVRPVGRVRKTAFYAFVVLFALMILGMSPLPYAVLGWFLEETVTHRIHETAFGFIFVLSLAGLLAQLRRPTYKVAQMWQAAIPIWLTLFAIILIGDPIDPPILLFLVIPAVIIVLHPGRPLLFRPPIALSRILGALTLVAVIPLLAFAVGEFRIGQEAAAVAGDVIENLPEDIPDDEVDRRLKAAADTPEEEQAALHFGHWSAMAAFAVSIVSLAGVASLRPPGWRLSGWSAGLAAFVYGLASLIVPDDASAATAVWAVLAIVWGIGFIVAAEYEVRSARAAEVTTSPATA